MKRIMLLQKSSNSWIHHAQTDRRVIVNLTAHENQEWLVEYFNSMARHDHSSPYNYVPCKLRQKCWTSSKLYFSWHLQWLVLCICQLYWVNYNTDQTFWDTSHFCRQMVFVSTSPLPPRTILSFFAIQPIHHMSTLFGGGGEGKNVIKNLKIFVSGWYISQKRLVSIV